MTRRRSRGANVNLPNPMLAGSPNWEQRTRQTSKEIAPGVTRIDVGEPAGPLRSREENTQ